MIFLILIAIIPFTFGQDPIRNDAVHATAAADAHVAAAAQSLPPPGPIGGFPGGYPGFPGLGFSKSISAGYGPFLGALGGLGGLGGLSGLGAPPLPIDGPIGDPGLGVGGFGGLGPSYLPASLIGSWGALKGDILFPCVIVVFFIVGVWTVINFLLALAVPFIAKKMSMMGMMGAMGGKKSMLRREVQDPDPDSPENQKILDGIEKMENEWGS